MTLGKSPEAAKWPTAAELEKLARKRQEEKEAKKARRRNRIKLKPGQKREDAPAGQEGYPPGAGGGVEGKTNLPYVANPHAGSRAMARSPEKIVLEQES